MTHTIENKYLTVSVKQAGAELCNIISRRSGQEYIWNADPDVWGSSAPVLFPIIGNLKNDTYTYQGNAYSLSKHGMVRNSDHFELESLSEDCLVLKYQSDEETLKVYPFNFVLYVTFQLAVNRLLVNYKVENLGSNNMLFSLGAHPGFNCPLKEGEKYSDYYIEFEQSETASALEVNEAGLCTGNTFPVLDQTNNLPLTKTIFEDDALIFNDLKSKKVSLKNIHNNQYVSLSFPDFNYLGIWAKPNASFVCIEPWMGVPDSVGGSGELENKEGMISLAEKNVFNAQYQIKIVE